MTISEQIRLISNDIQETFEELIKLVIRKSIPPGLNKIAPKTVFNPFTGMGEQALIIGCNGDCVNKYTYRITNRALGWTDDIIVSFRMNVKFAKTADNIYPTSKIPCNSGNTNCSSSEYRCNVLGSNTPLPIALTVPSTVNPTEVFKYMMDNIFSNNISRSCGKFADPNFDVDATYSDIFKILNSIGVDIINQTDISILPDESARMSTAMLRARLYNLERTLGSFSQYFPQMYENYISMITLINSLSKEKIVWFINLIGVLSYQRWEELGTVERNKFIKELGLEIIEKVDSNELITILLQSGSPELILTSSYLYPLLKMLFVVFGFNKIEPIIENINCSNIMTTDRLQALQSYFDRNAGARLLRPQIIDDDFSSEQSTISRSPSVDSIASQSSYCSTISTQYEPLDPTVYAFVKIFCTIYPTLTSFMGCDNLPEENRKIVCSMIPRNYSSLRCILEFLWRYFDYSYCKYVNYINSRVVNNALQAKITSKVRYLKNL